MWAVLAGFLLAGDVLSLPAWIGCGLILLGMIVGVLRFSLPKAGSCVTQTMRPDGACTQTASPSTLTA